MEEDRYLKAGRESVVWDTSFGPVAMAICYDLRFPEMIRKLARRGAKLLLIPAEWPDPRLRHWQVLTEARAIENGFYVIGANRVGAEDGLNFPGHGRIIDPWGEVLAEGGADEGVVSCEIEMHRVEEARTRINTLIDPVRDVD
jgi:predicted amidohydrolase